MELPDEFKNRVFLDEQDLPKIFGMGFSRQHMRNLRLAGEGPRCVKVGRHWKYPVAEVISWMENKT